jgi:hypothetical protein
MKWHGNEADIESKKNRALLASSGKHRDLPKRSYLDHVVLDRIGRIEIILAIYRLQTKLLAKAAVLCDSKASTSPNGAPKLSPEAKREEKCGGSASIRTMVFPALLATN